MNLDIKPKSVVKIVNNILARLSMSLPVKTVPENAVAWTSEGIADTAVEINGKTAIIPGYDGMLQAVMIVNGEYRDIGYTSRIPQKVAVRAVAKYIQMHLKCDIKDLI